MKSISSFLNTKLRKTDAAHNHEMSSEETRRNSVPISHELSCDDDYLPETRIRARSAAVLVLGASELFGSPPTPTSTKAAHCSVLASQDTREDPLLSRQLTGEEMLECQVEEMDDDASEDDGEITSAGELVDTCNVYEVVRLPSDLGGRDFSVYPRRPRSSQVPQNDNFNIQSRRSSNFSLLRMLGFSDTGISSQTVSSLQQPSPTVPPTDNVRHQHAGVGRTRKISTESLNSQTNWDTKVTALNKLRSVWNNVKYGWTIKIRPNFPPDVPIYLLGNCYLQTSNDHSGNPPLDIHGNPFEVSVESFFRDYASRLWFTYRDPLPPFIDIVQSKCGQQTVDGVGSRVAGSEPVTSDCGWGCMLRCGQMLLGQALVVHYLGRDWTYYGPNDLNSARIHRQIVRWFGDTCDEIMSPLSLHELVKNSGQRAGQWFGPATACRLLRDTLVEAAQKEPRLSDLVIYLAEDRVVFRQDILNLARGYGVQSSNKESTSHSPMTSSSFENSMALSQRVIEESNSSIEEGVEAVTLDQEDSNQWRSVLILIPLHLGGPDRLNSGVYAPVLQRMLAERSCVGILAGRPGRSVFVLGCQENRVVYLDPHFCQRTVDVTPSDFPLNSYHCLFPRTMDIKRLDPSCAVGFYLKSRDDLKRWLRLAPVLSANSAYPLIEVVQGSRPSDDEEVLAGLIPSGAEEFLIL